MNKKTLAIVLAIALAIGAFAGLSFNLFSASAETYVPVGDELVTTTGTGWMSYKSDESASDQYFVTFKDDGNEDLHFAQMATNPYVAGEILPVEGATKYFNLPKRSISTSADWYQIKERVVLYARVGTLDSTANQDNTYIISTWVKLPEATTDTITVKFTTSQYSTNIVGNPRLQSESWTLTTEWQQISWAFNPDASQNDVFFGLALSKASAIDFMPISLKKAVAATPEPTATATPVVTAAPTPEPSFVPVGEELATTASAGWLSYWVKAKNTEAQKGIFFTSFDNTGAEKHYAQFDPVPYVAGTNLPVAGATKYFAIPKKTIDTNVSNPTLRERIVFMAKTTGATNANAADSTLGAGMEDGINKDKTYIISVWVKLPEATTETVKAYFSTARWTANIAGVTLSKSQEWTLTTQWQQISWAFNPDTTDTTNDNNNEMFFGLALTQASAVDFVGLSIREAGIATPEPTATATPVATAVPTATPTPEPSLVPIGKEYANTNSGAWVKYWVKDTDPSGQEGIYITTIGYNGSDKHFAQMSPIPYVEGTNLPVAGATKYFALPKNTVDPSVSYYNLRERLVFSAKTTSNTGAGLDDEPNKDKTYVISAWVKLPEASTNTIKVNFATSQYVVNIVGSPRLKSQQWTLTTEWQYISWVFNPDASQNDLFFGLALSEASAIDFVGLSIREAGIATPAPSATATPTPAPTPIYVGDGVEMAEPVTETYNSVVHNSYSFIKYNATRPLPLAFKNDPDGDGLVEVVSTRGDDKAGLRHHWQNMREMEKGLYLFKASVYVPEATGDTNINMGFGLNIFPANAAQKKSFTVPAATWTEISFLVEVKTVVPMSSTEGYILGFFNQTAADDVLFYVDNISFQKAVEYKEPAGNGGNAGGSNTGDVLPVAMIAVATISACGLVIIARRKRED